MIAFLASLALTLSIRSPPPAGRLTAGEEHALQQQRLGAMPSLDDEEASLLASVGGKNAATYGEMTSMGFRTLATHIGLGAEDIFVDLGSGEGALVLQAADEFGVAHATGIELAETRHAAAVDALAAVPEDVRARTTLIIGDAAGDVAADVLAQASVVWCANLLFDDALQRRLAARLGDAVCAGKVRAIASLMPFPEGVRGLVQEDEYLRCDMSWDVGDAHPCVLYLRRDPNV